MSAVPVPGSGAPAAASALVGGGTRGARSPLSTLRAFSLCLSRTRPRISIATGELRRYARPRPKVQCVRAPSPPGSQHKKTGGQAAACVIFVPGHVLAHVRRRRPFPNPPMATHTHTIAARSPPRGRSRKMGGTGGFRGASATRASNKAAWCREGILDGVNALVADSIISIAYYTSLGSLTRARARRTRRD